MWPVEPGRGCARTLSVKRLQRSLPTISPISVARFWSLEGARFALTRHFLCLEELLPRQTFSDDVSVLGRQLGVRVTGYCRGEIEPHMGAYAVVGDSSPVLVHDAKVELGFSIALLSRHSCRRRAPLITMAAAATRADNVALAAR